MSTATAPLMTAEEFIRDYGHTDGYELDRGQLVRIPMPTGKHGYLCGRAFTILNEFVTKHDLGRLATNDSFICTLGDPPSIRGADVLYVSYAQLPKNQEFPDTAFDFPPELVVEVRSKSDRPKTVMKKCREYLDAGVKVVIIVDPVTESVGVHAQDEFPIHFHNGDTVTVQDVLPGFEVPVKAFFE